MTPVRIRVIHGGEDEQASIERKRSRDDALGTAGIHGDEDEKGVDPKKEVPNKPNAEQTRARKSEAEAKRTLSQ